MLPPCPLNVAGSCRQSRNTALRPADRLAGLRFDGGPESGSIRCSSLAKRRGRGQEVTCFSPARWPARASRHVADRRRRGRSTRHRDVGSSVVRPPSGARRGVPVRAEDGGETRVVDLEGDRRRRQVEVVGVLPHHLERHELERERLVGESDLRDREGARLGAPLLDHADLLDPEPAARFGVVHVRHDVPDPHSRDPPACSDGCVDAPGPPASTGPERSVLMILAPDKPQPLRRGCKATKGLPRIDRHAESPNFHPCSGWRQTWDGRRLARPREVAGRAC